MASDEMFMTEYMGNIMGRTTSAGSVTATTRTLMSGKTLKPPIIQKRINLPPRPITAANSQNQSINDKTTKTLNLNNSSKYKNTNYTRNLESVLDEELSHYYQVNDNYINENENFVFYGSTNSTK